MKFLLALLLAVSPLWAQDVQPPISDPPEWTRLRAHNPPGERFTNLSYNWLMRETILIGGMKDRGDGWGEWENDVWHWNGETWRLGYYPAPPAKAPLGFSATAFHSGYKSTLEFGGTPCWPCGAQGTRDVWVYDQSGGVPGTEIWTRASRPPCSAERQAAQMVYDAGRQVLVVFGGTTNDNGLQALSSTWELTSDWETWKKFGGVNPPPRYNHQMVYDSAREKVVLFGGRRRNQGSGPEYTVYGDTWTFNGRKWANLYLNGPPRRYSHGMAYDLKRRVTVLFGGQCICPQKWLADTWQFNGTRWKELSLAVHPSARALPAMVGTHQEVLLYGGYRGLSEFDEDLWRFGN